jgi:hypothetical protein
MLSLSLPSCPSEFPRVESNYLDTSQRAPGIAAQGLRPAISLLDESSETAHPYGGSSTYLKGSPNAGGDPRHLTARYDGRPAVARRGLATVLPSTYSRGPAQASSG